MAASLAQSNSDNAPALFNANNVPIGATVAYAKRVTAGNAMIVVAGCQSEEPAPDPIIDSLGNQYVLVQAGNREDNNHPFVYAVWLASNAVAGTGNLVLPFHGPTVWSHMAFGGVLADPLDNSGGVSTHNVSVSVDYATSVPGEVLCGYLVTRESVVITTPPLLPVTQQQVSANGSLKAGWGAIAQPTAGTLSWTLATQMGLAGGWISLKV